MFLQISQIQIVGKRKKVFSYFVSEIPKFSYMGFFRKCLMFRWSIPLNRNLKREIEKISDISTSEKQPYVEKIVVMNTKWYTGH